MLTKSQELFKGDAIRVVIGVIKFLARLLLRYVNMVDHKACLNEFQESSHGWADLILK